MMKKVQQYIKRMHMITKSDRIVVGVSGGADSVALLLMLQAIRAELKLELFVVHVNHGIRVEAAEDAEYVKQLCECLKVPFYLFETDIPAMAREQGVTEEEMGRLYRYQCFGRVMQQVEAHKLAVAHHMDDQAETVLFHMIRGSRIAGMEGMRPVTEFALEDLQQVAQNGVVIRPLLCCRKEEVVQWLQQQRVAWKEDYTNQENVYSRNCIRNQVMPVLEQVNTRAVEHMAELAEEMTAYREFFQKTVDAYIKNEVCSVVEESEICAEEVLGEPKVVAFACDRVHLLRQDKILADGVIYEMLVALCGRKKDLGNVHVQAVYDLLKNQSGKKISLPYHMEAEISYEKLIIRKRLKETVEETAWEFVIPIVGEEVQRSEREWLLLPDGSRLRAHLFQKRQCSEQQWKQLVEEAQNSKNNYTKFFEYDTIKDTLCVRPARSDDYFVVHENGSRKKVSRYFIDEKIPGEQRKHVVVLAEKQRVLWVIGRRRCEECKVTENSEMVLKLTYERV